MFVLSNIFDKDDIIYFQGLAPPALLSTEPIEKLEDVFYKGQVVRCKVVDLNPLKKKLKLSFVVSKV